MTAHKIVGDMLIAKFLNKDYDHSPPLKGGATTIYQRFILSSSGVIIVC